MFDNIEKLINEIDYLKRSHMLLDDITGFISPYGEIRISDQKDFNKLCRVIHEHLYNFDDSE